MFEQEQVEYETSVLINNEAHKINLEYAVLNRKQTWNESDKKSRQSFAQCSLLLKNTYIISLYKGINQIGFKDFSRAFFNRDNSQGLFGLQNHFALEFRAEKGYGGR